MKNSIKLALLVCLAAAGCKSKDKYEAMAEDLCTCMKPMADLQKKLMSMIDEGRQEDIMNLSEEAQKVDEDGQACIRQLEKKHGQIKGAEEETKAMDALRKICPDIVELMEATADPEMMMPDTLPEDLDAVAPDSLSGQ
jgi:hypothetical protein